MKQRRMAQLVSSVDSLSSITKYLNFLIALSSIFH